MNKLPKAVALGLVSLIFLSGCGTEDMFAPGAAPNSDVQVLPSASEPPPILAETHTLVGREFGVQDYQKAGLSASAYVSGNTVIFFAGGCDTFTAEILSNSELSAAVRNPMKTMRNSACNPNMESTNILKQHLDNVAAGTGEFQVLGEQGFMLDGVHFGFAIYEWVTPPALPDNFFRDQFEVIDITNSIPDADWAAWTEEHIPGWRQESDGSVTVFFSGPQGTPNFDAFSPYPVPLNNHIQELVITEGWTGETRELNRRWAFNIRGSDGAPIYPTQVAFFRDDGKYEPTEIPKLPD